MAGFKKKRRKPPLHPSSGQDRNRLSRACPISGHRKSPGGQRATRAHRGYGACAPKEADVVIVAVPLAPSPELVDDARDETPHAGLRRFETEGNVSRLTFQYVWRKEEMSEGGEGHLPMT